MASLQHSCGDQWSNRYNRHFLPGESVSPAWQQDITKNNIDKEVLRHYTGDRAEGYISDKIKKIEHLCIIDWKEIESSNGALLQDRQATKQICL